MTYIEIIKRGRKRYFYLTKNIRLSDEEWKKVRVYLGDKKPTASEIKKRAGEIESKIDLKGLAKSEFAYLSKADAEMLQDLKESYDVWLKKIPESFKKKMYEDFVIRFTYNTNAIEGNRLTLRQTALILGDKVIPSGVRTEDYNEAINGKECMDFIKEYKGGLNTSFLEKINSLLTKNTGVVYSGRIRFFDVQIHGASHKPPEAKEVKRYLFNLYKWYSANKKKLHPFELAALVHAKIAWIHPFEDGNGRTARAVMNWILMRKGFPMFFIPVEKRAEYYSAIEEADKDNYKVYISEVLKLIIDQTKIYGHK